MRYADNNDTYFHILNFFALLLRQRFLTARRCLPSAAEQSFLLHLLLLQYRLPPPLSSFTPVLPSLPLHYMA